MENRLFNLGRKIVVAVSEPEELKTERTDFEGKMDQATHTGKAQTAVVAGKTVTITDNGNTRQASVGDINSLV